MSANLQDYDTIFTYSQYYGTINQNSIVSNLESSLFREGNEDAEFELQSLTSKIFSGISYNGILLATGAETDVIIKMIEDIFVLIRGLTKAQTRADCVVAVAIFAKLRSTGSLSKLIVEQWDRIMDPTLQSGDRIERGFAQMRKLLDNYDAVKVMPIFTKLYRFICFGVATSLFERMGVSFDFARYLLIEKSILDKQFQMGPDFIHCVLDTALYICETGYQCMKTGSLDPIFHHQTSYEKWNEAAELLRTQSKFISNPEPHGFTIFDFLNRLDNVIEQGEAIYKFHAKDRFAGRACKQLLFDMKAIRAEALTKRLAQQDRKAPFALLIAGGSSVGKSTFTKMLYYHYGKLFKLPTDPEYRYVRNPFDQYWTNFNSSQWCVQLDDIAFLHPNSSAGCDPSLMEMLQVVNNVPYVPTQADLADKGRTPMRSKFVIATSNTESLNARSYFACPLAVQRRLPYVVNIVPKDQYLREGFMLDTSKLPPTVDGSYPNFWNITIKKVVPSQTTNTHMGQTGDLTTIHIFEDIKDFLLWFNTVARDAEATQDGAMACDTGMSNSQLCDCGLPKSMCDCVDDAMIVQDGEIITYQTPWITEMNRRIRRAQEEEDEESCDPGYARTMRSIYKQISLMNIITRCVVMFHVFMMYLMGRSALTRAIIWFFYGNWFTFFTICRFLHIPEMRHILVSMLGYKAYSGLCRSKNVLICISAVTAAITLYKTYSSLTSLWNSDESKEKPTLQGVSEDRGQSPEPKGDKQENVWYKDDYECTPFDVTPSAMSRCSWSIDNLVKYVASNCVFFQIRVRKSEGVLVEKRTKAVCLGGHIYMCNNHSVLYDSFELEITYQNKKDGVSTNMVTLVTPIQIKRFPERDLCFINISSVPPKKNIIDCFVNASFRGKFDGIYFGREIDGSIYNNRTFATKYVENKQVSDDSLSQDIFCDMWSSITDTQTRKGDCGSLHIVQSAFGPVIIGIHVLGYIKNNVACSLAINREFLIKEFPSLISPGAPTLCVGEYSQEIIDLDVKSPMRFIESGTAQVFGSVAGFRKRMRSHVTKTYMSDLAVEHGYQRVTGPPMMNSWVPWRLAALDMTRPVTHIDLTLLNQCKESFITDLLSGLTKEDLSELIVYDNLTAVNGKPGLAYVDKLNRSTSAGFPFRKSKKYFLEHIDPIDEMQHPVMPTAEIMEEMDKIITCYESGNTYSPVFTASLKDEPTALKKCALGKTRVFCGAPMPWSIVVRKYLLSTIRLIQKNRLLFESGPGTIAQSLEWDQLYVHLTQFGEDRMVAGDYGKFDKRMPASVILAAFDIIKNLLIAAGWSERDLMVINGIAEDTAFPTIDFHGDLIRCYGTNPSGHPLTVIINGLANSLYVRYCYTKNHPKQQCSDFKENVALMTYGDDMIMGVNPNCHWINHTIMQQTLAEIDIEFTMADKETKSVPFIHISEATFLRRCWRYEPELKAHVCPIEHASIDKMMTMCVASKTVSRQFQAIEVMNTALREYFWYGKEEFTYRRRLLTSFVEELELEVYMERNFPTWEQLVNEFHANSKLR